MPTLLADADRNCNVAEQRQHLGRMAKVHAGRLSGNGLVVSASVGVKCASSTIAYGGATLQACAAGEGFPVTISVALQIALQAERVPYRF